MLTVAGGIILLEYSCCYTLILLMLAVAEGDNFTRIQLLLHVYFTNAGSCWWGNFTRMLLLLHTYFTITQPI